LCDVSNVGFGIKNILINLKESFSKFTYVSLRIPVSLMILVSITIFSTVLGVGYLKEALLDAISILNFGTVVSEYRPLQNPLQ
jgi:hypothetical protein